MNGTRRCGTRVRGLYRLSPASVSELLLGYRRLCRLTGWGAGRSTGGPSLRIGAASHHFGEYPFKHLRVFGGPMFPRGFKEPFELWLFIGWGRFAGWHLAVAPHQEGLRGTAGVRGELAQLYYWHNQEALSPAP